MYKVSKNTNFRVKKLAAAGDPVPYGFESRESYAWSWNENSSFKFVSLCSLYSS